MVPQRGAIVSAPSLEEALDLYEVRAGLESLVVTHFVERATDAEVAALAATVEDLWAVSRTATDIRSNALSSES